MPRTLALLPILAALVACYDGLSEPIACTEEARPGIILTVVEVGTLDPVTEGLEGTLVEGTYEEEMATLGGDNVLFGATERPGLYTATVSAPGYEAWQRSGIRVIADECHVITRDLNVALLPSE